MFVVCRQDECGRRRVARGASRRGCGGRYAAHGVSGHDSSEVGKMNARRRRSGRKGFVASAHRLPMRARCCEWRRRFGDAPCRSDLFPASPLPDCPSCRRVLRWRVFPVGASPFSRRFVFFPLSVRPSCQGLLVPGSLAGTPSRPVLSCAFPAAGSFVKSGGFRPFFSSYATEMAVEKVE